MVELLVCYLELSLNEFPFLRSTLPEGIFSVACCTNGHQAWRTVGRCTWPCPLAISPGRSRLKSAASGPAETCSSSVWTCGFWRDLVDGDSRTLLECGRDSKRPARAPLYSLHWETKRRSRKWLHLWFHGRIQRQLWRLCISLPPGCRSYPAPKQKLRISHRKYTNTEIVGNSFAFEDEQVLASRGSSSSENHSSSIVLADFSALNSAERDPLDLGAKIIIDNLSTLGSDSTQNL